MRVLMISTRIPYPLTAGFRIRIYNEAKYLKKNGHIVDLIYFSKEKESKEYKEKLEEIFTEIHNVHLNKIESLVHILRKSIFGKLPFQVSLYLNKRMDEMIQQIAPKYDVIIGNHIRSAEYLKKLPQKKIILDYHDAISYNYGRIPEKGIKKLFYDFEGIRVLKYEVECSKLFEKCVIISENDKEYLVQHGAENNNIYIIPVAVRDDITNKKTTYESDEEAICFLGKMNYQPNEDAVIWFSQKIFQMLKSKYQDLKFYIIGTNPTEKVKNLENEDGVIVTGYIENPYEIVRKCKAMVVPIRNGAGMQNKILESMVVGTPTVISPIAAEGLAGEPGVHYLVTDTYEKEISELLESVELRQQIGKDSQRLVNDNYTWEKLTTSWEKLITE